MDYIQNSNVINEIQNNEIRANMDIDEQLEVQIQYIINR